MANMLYNGVELPDIDTAWTNQDKYPYAAITYAYSSDGIYELWLSSEPFLVRTYSGSEAISLFAPESYNVDYQRWRVLIGDWALMDSSTVWANNTLNGEGNLVYATYDVYDTAENLYLAGSTHTGGSGGGGDGDDTHTHSFIPTTIDPTCTESGYVIYECDCGSSYRGDDIPATGHQWDGNTCTVCGVTRTVRHSNVIDFFAGLMMGQKIKKIKNGVAKATQYLYGTPSETGNIGLRVGESVTLYDGAVLPKAPDEIMAYEYVYLVRFDELENTLRGLTDEPHTRFVDGFKDDYDVLDSDGGTWRCAIASDTATEWKLYEEESVPDTFTGTNFNKLKWANFNIYTSGGDLYIPKSAPIPVSGIVDYVGDIPIYE